MKPELSRRLDTSLTRARDAALIQATLAGTSAAFAELIGLYRNRVMAVGMSFFHNTEDAEDFVQEVFIKAYLKLGTFRGQSSFSTWLTRIAYTTALNEKQRRPDYVTLADETLIPFAGETPEESSLRAVTAQAVKEALRELPPQYAVCLDFYFFYDLSYEEIAVITDFPVNTIKSHIFRAKKILRRKLQEYAG